MDLKRSAVRKEGGTPHLGSAHTDAEVELLRAVGAQRIAAGQDQLPLDVAAPREPAALEITSSRMGRLLAAIAAVYCQLGFDLACGGMWCSSSW
jgi:hypothetical protein